jgi:N-acetylglucosamine kinase-like BadF-type ATPase
VTYVLGVDGGTTKTIALVARPDGTIAGVGRGGGSNIYAVSLETAFAHVDQAVAAALGGAGIGPDALAVGAFSMCGADWPEDHGLFREELTGRGYGRTVLVVNDGVGGLAAGLAGSPERHGVAVVCGSGVATAARGQDGRVWHSSFWQDFGAGGGIHMGHLALRAVFRAEVEIDPPTTLTARVLEHFGQSSVERLLHRLTARSAAPVDIGALARLLLDEAERGDESARRIVRRQGQALGDYALVAARRVGIAETAYPLVLAGGVLRHPARLLVSTLVERVRRASPAVRPVETHFEPAAGALLLAIEAAGSAANGVALENLKRTMPPATFFAT